MTIAQDSSAAHPDLSQVESQGHLESPFPLPGARRQEPQIVLRQSARNAIYGHGTSQPNVEVCGVLLGQVYQDAVGPFVQVEATIRGEHSDNQLAQVTFTAATWTHIQTVLERDYPALRILGWYHTHPGFGIFLSEMDLFIHRNFFSDPDQVALVFDPQSGEEGVFVWRRGEPVREETLVDYDEPATASRSGTMGDWPILSAASSDIPARVARLESRQRILAWLLAFVTVVALAWPWLVLQLGQRERADDAPISVSPLHKAKPAAAPLAEPDDKQKNRYDAQQ
jgi:proteasome lid subunit RPN8/RPN11